MSPRFSHLPDWGVVEWAKAENDSESSRKATESEGDNLEERRVQRECLLRESER